MNDIGLPSGKRIAKTLTHKPPQGDHQDSWRLLICLLAFGVYLAPDLATMTMGLDGVVYASIAKLIAAADTKFWFPPWHSSPDLPFQDHPPLGLWLQGQWFKLFGDAFWVENAFISALMLTNAGLVLQLWRDLTGRPDGWRPLLILFLIPVTSFTLRSNALENLVSIIALASIICAWHGRRNPWLNLLVGALCGIGFLIKGPVALFPLIAPMVLAAIVDRDWIRGCARTLICTGAYTAFMAIMMTNPEALQMLSSYLDRQVLGSLLGEWPIVNNRGYLLYHLGLSLGVCGVCGAIAWLTSRTWIVDRRFWAVLVIGCAAAVPLLISPRQFKHYLLPSLPYFAIAAAMLSEMRLPKIPRQILILTCAALLTLLVTRFTSSFGEPGKDSLELEQAAQIASNAQGSTVTLCKPHPMLQAYLARHHDLNSTVVPGQPESPGIRAKNCIDL